MKKSLRSTLFLIFFVVALVVLWKYLDFNIPDVIPTVRPATEVSPSVPPVVSESYFTAYFTSPPLDSRIQGIEKNLINLIDNAKVSVHGAFYEMDLGDVVDALIAAKARGIDVRLVYDNGQMDSKERIGILKKLAGAGIPLVPDERSAFMHDKFMVIDGKTVWTGSFNYTGNAAYKNNENAVVFEVPFLAANYEREFSEMFDGKFGAKSPADTPYPVIKFDAAEIDNYFAPEDEVMQKVITEVKSADYSIDFLSFSFTDPNLGYTISELALENDVSVRGVFESSQDMGDSVCPYLMLRSQNIEGNGSITVKLDGNPATMHEKVIVIDGEVVIFGSFNFSRNADENNDENLLIVRDPNLARLFTAEFQKVYDQAVLPVAGCKKP